MDLQQLRCFSVTASHFSVTKAAALLSTTQSTVSHHISKLEAELKTSLFERTSGGMKLTAAGRELLPHALNIMEEMAQIDRKLKKQKDRK